MITNCLDVLFSFNMLEEATSVEPMSMLSPRIIFGHPATQSTITAKALNIIGVAC